MPAGYRTLSTMTKGQSGFLQQLLGQLQGQNSNIGQNPLYQQGSQFLQGLLSSEGQQKFAAPHMRQFNEQTIPALAERFSGLGAGSQSSSAFQQALGQAGAGLQEKLAALHGGLGLQGAGLGLGYAQQPISNLQGLGGLGLGSQAFGYTQKQRPFWQELLGGSSHGIGQLLSMLPFLL